MSFSSQAWCRYCGHQLPSGARFCRTCGAPVAASVAPAPGEASSVVCQECGRANELRARFCRNCGSGLERTATQSDEAPVPTQVLPTVVAPSASVAPTGQGGPAPVPRRARHALPVLALVALLLVGGTGLAVVLLRGGSGHDHKQTTRSTDAATTSTATSSAASGEAEIRSRTEVVGILREYEKDYSLASAEALGGLLARDVHRHGLAADGCTEVSGQQAVLEAYESQFAADGRIAYRLLGLSASSVHLEGISSASVDTHYLIPSSGNTGYVDFTLTREAPGWRISGIDATCHPSYS